MSITSSIPTWTIAAFTLLIGGVATDYWWGKFEFYGVDEKRPLADKSKDRWPKKDE